MKEVVIKKYRGNRGTLGIRSGDGSVAPVNLPEGEEFGFGPFSVLEQRAKFLARRHGVGISYTDVERLLEVLRLRRAH